MSFPPHPLIPICLQEGASPRPILLFEPELTFVPGMEQQVILASYTELGGP